MKPPPVVVHENTPFEEVARVFATAPYRHLPVVTLQNELRGLIALREVERQLQNHQSRQWATAASLMRTDLELVTPETSLPHALEAFSRYRGETLLVVKALSDRILVGYLSKTDLLLALAHGIQGGPH